MYGFEYTIELLEPVLANSLAGDANSAQSLHFIPGSLMRGAVIGEYLKRPQPVFDVGDEDGEARRLFFNGQTRYLHAYPVTNEGQRTLPAPLVWQKRKTLATHEAAEQRDLFDLSIRPEEREKQLVSLGEERFCALSSDKEASWVEIGEQLNVHTQRDAVAGRAKEDVGAVFRYEALPAGLQLKGIVLAERSEDAATLKDLLNGKTLHLGKSRTAGYGAIKVKVDQDLREGWKEAVSPDVTTDEQAKETDSLETNDESGADGYGEAYGSPEGDAPPSYFSLTVLSDTLIRDAHGQHTLDLLPALARKLGLPVGRLKLDGERSFCKAEIVGGFNRKWGLPLPQVAAIAAGSTFMINVSPPHSPDELREWQRALREDGLGERRVDGFGRIVIEWYRYEPKAWVKDKSATPPSPQASITLNDATRTLTEQMLLRLLRRDVDRLLVEAAHGYRVIGDIPNSQLSRWRSVIYSALNERQTGRVTKFLIAEEEKGSRGWEAMRRARVKVSDKEQPRVTDWIKGLLAQTDFPWEHLTKSQQSFARSLNNDSNHPSYVSAEPTPEMAIEYRLRLIDGVLALAAKRGKNHV